MANRTGPAWHRDRVRQLERRRTRLLALLAENRNDLELAYDAAEDMCEYRYIVRARHVTLFDEFPECESSNVVRLDRGGK